MTDLATPGNEKQSLSGIEIAVARNRAFAETGKHDEPPGFDGDFDARVRLAAGEVCQLRRQLQDRGPSLTESAEPISIFNASACS